MRATGACMTDVGALAGQLGGLTTAQIESLLQEFADNGEDRTLSRLLQVCAFNGVQLDPKVLCGCLGVCEFITDPVPCFALQDERAIEPLLEAAAAEALPLERKCFAARLAAELTAKFNLDPPADPQSRLEARAPGARAGSPVPARAVPGDSGRRKESGRDPNFPLERDSALQAAPGAHSAERRRRLLHRTSADPQAWPQRPLSLRQRQEIQEVLLRQRSGSASRCLRVCRCHPDRFEEQARLGR